MRRNLECTTPKGEAAKLPPALLSKKKGKQTFRRGKHLVFKDQQPAKQVFLLSSFSLMTTSKVWQTSFFNLLKHYASMWEYWLWQALFAVSFVSERNCLHFKQSQRKLYSICGRIIRWSIVLLLEVENELCSRRIILYIRSSRSISNIQMLTRAVPHAEGVCLLLYDHTHIYTCPGRGRIQLWHHSLQLCRCPASRAEVPVRHQRSRWRVYFESLRNIHLPKFQKKYDLKNVNKTNKKASE